MQDRGLRSSLHKRDDKAAAAEFQRASEVPGAPNWLRPLAAVTLAEGGHRNASRALWEQLAKSEEACLRSAATLRRAQLAAMDIMEAWRLARQQRGMAPPLPL